MNIEPSKWAYAASEEIAPSYNEFDVLAAAYTIDNLAIEPAIAQLRADLARVTAEAGAERDTNALLLTGLATATRNNASLAARLTAAELERDRLGAELEELQGAHDLNQIASEALDELRADLARVTAANAKLSHELYEHRASTDQYAKELAALRARVAEVEKERDEWKRNAEADTESMDAANRRAEQAEQRVAELEATIAELTTDGNAATLAANLAKASKRNAELVEQLKAYGEYAHDTTLEDQNAELVAALRVILEIVDADGADESYDKAIAQEAACALARAESAAPAKQEAAR